MYQIDTPLPSFQGVAAGQTAMLTIPIGRRIHQIDVVFAGVTLAQLDEVRVVANGEVIHTYSGAQRDAMNQFDGLADATVDDILVIPFDRTGLKQGDNEVMTALNTGVADANGRSINELRLEVDINAGAAAPVLTAYATESDAIPGGPGVIRRIMRDYVTAAAAGQVQFDKLQFGGNRFALINRIFFGSAEAVLTDAEIIRNNYRLFKRTAVRNRVRQSDYGRAPQAGWYVYDTTERAYGAAMLNIEKATDFRLMLEFAGAAANVPVLTEYMGSL